MRQETIGMIGLGLLGSALAERFLGAGLQVVGHDLDPQRLRELAGRGGRAAPSVADALSGERLVLSLPTSEVVAGVLDDLGDRLRPGMVVVDTTTGEPEQTAALGKRLAGRGVTYLDATVAGSSAEARQGRVVVMVGGPREGYDRCADLFACFARECFHVGPWGHGARMKLAVNLVLGLNRAVLAEGLAFARRLGLDPATALAVFRAGAAYSRAMDAKGEKMLAGDFTPQARLAQHLKDVFLILDAGARAGARLPLSETHRGLLEQCAAAGLADADNSAIIKAFE